MLHHQHTISIRKNRSLSPAGRFFDPCLPDTIRRHRGAQRLVPNTKRQTEKEAARRSTLHRITKRTIGLVLRVYLAAADKLMYQVSIFCRAFSLIRASAQANGMQTYGVQTYGDATNHTPCAKNMPVGQMWKPRTGTITSAPDNDNYHYR